jgi:hypothetical protein
MFFGSLHALAPLAASASGLTLAPVQPPRGAHPRFSVEWCYTTGHATAAHGQRYFWFATIWTSALGAIGRVNVIDLRRDRWCSRGSGRDLRRLCAVRAIRVPAICASAGGRSAGSGAWPSRARRRGTVAATVIPRRSYRKCRAEGSAARTRSGRRLSHKSAVMPFRCADFPWRLRCGASHDGVEPTCRRLDALHRRVVGRFSNASYLCDTLDDEQARLLDRGGRPRLVRGGSQRGSSGWSATAGFVKEAKR